LGLLFNIRLPVNFNHPYAARNIIDFWRRWHISLSTFLRDYLYIALGGNRHGTLRRYINLAITMLLGGLWHGANWTFVAWGAMHGLALVVNHGWRHLRGTTPNTSSVEKAFYWLLTFVFVCFTWVVFRADAMESAWVIYKGMLGLGGLDWNLQLPAWKREYNLYLSISLLLYLIAARHIKDWCFTYDRAAPSTQTIPFVLAAFTVLVFLISVEQIGQASAFLYFQF
jgi:alginate O-acetyltransferase complex protein AlgI